MRRAGRGTSTSTSSSSPGGWWASMWSRSVATSSEANGSSRAMPGSGPRYSPGPGLVNALTNSSSWPMVQHSNARQYRSYAAMTESP
jgi:hypothetical protein